MIVGHGRSGSSIIERMLGGSDGFTNVGELLDPFKWRLDGAACRCGQAIDTCPFWHDVGRAALGGWDPVAATQLIEFFLEHLRYPTVPLLQHRLRGAAPDHPARRYAATFESLYLAISERTDNAIIIDSTKHLGHLICIAQFADVDFKVLHLVRDPRGNAYSWQKQGIDLAAVGRPGEQLATFSPARTAIGWSIRNLLIERFVPRHIPRARVRYEDFTTDPTGVLSQALATLGVSPTPNWSHVHDHVVDLPDDHAFGGNPGVAQRQSARIAPDDEWRVQLSARSRRVVTALSFPVMIRYGYRLRNCRPTATD